MNKVARRGVIRGNTVELDSDAGLPEGQAVTVFIQAETSKKPGDGLLRSFGGWSDDPEGVDRFIEETRRLRDLDDSHREIEP